MEMARRLIYERLGPQPRLIMAKSVCRKSAVTERGGEGCVVSRAAPWVRRPATHYKRLITKPRVIKNEARRVLELESCSTPLIRRLFSTWVTDVLLSSVERRQTEAAR